MTCTILSQPNPSLSEGGTHESVPLNEELWQLGQGSLVFFMDEAPEATHVLVCGPIWLHRQPALQSVSILFSFVFLKREHEIMREMWCWG